MFAAEGIMSRIAVVACALGLAAGPLAAQELRLNPPTLSARAERCSSAQRALCEGAGRQRAIETNLSCEACGSPPLPAEIVPPAAADKAAPRLECLPRSAGPLSPPCAPTAPRLDNIPRP
jgi:hypothetical protein